MPNLNKLQEALRLIRGAVKDDDSFEELCKVLGEAIDMDGYALQLLVTYDVNVANAFYLSS